MSRPILSLQPMAPGSAPSSTGQLPPASTTAGLVVPTLPLSSLRLGAELGSGNQGTVHALTDDPHNVAKLYQAGCTPDPSALRAIVAARIAMSPQDRAVIDHRSAWPTAIVMDGAQPRGIVMRRIPDHCHTTTAAGPLLCMVQHLLHPARAAGIGLALPGDTDRAELVRQLAEVLDVAHRAGVVLGDISQRNLLWGRSRTGIELFVIDIDSGAASGGPPALPAVETPGWFEPSGTSPSLASDRYKLALAAFRVLHAEPTTVPSATDPRLGGTSAIWTPSLGDLTRRALHGPVASRPEAGHWLAPLTAVRDAVPTGRAPTTQGRGRTRPVLHSPTVSPGRPRLTPPTKARPSAASANGRRARALVRSLPARAGELVAVAACTVAGVVLAAAVLMVLG